MMKTEHKKSYMLLFYIMLTLILTACNALNAQAIKLIWEPIHDKNIKYCGIYRDTISNPIIEISKVPTTDTIYIDYDIVIGRTYYYRINSIDSADNRSAFSNEVCITVEYPTEVELDFFSAVTIDDKIILKWKTISESDIYGFEIQKSSTNLNFNKIRFVAGKGIPYNYEFLDTEISCTENFYRLKKINKDGSFKYSDVVKAIVKIPGKFELSQNYPNPFNSETVFKLTIAKEGNIHLTIFDLLGREVRRLINEYKKAGYYLVKWDGKDNSGNSVSAGIYFCQMRGKKFTKTKKIILTM